MRNNTWWVILFIIAPFAYAGYLYASLGEQIPIHFGMDGKPDNWASKNSIFVLPVILGFVNFFTWLILSNIDKIDPKQAAGDNKTTINKLSLFLSASLCGITLIILYSEGNEKAAVDKLLFGALGILFMGLGFFMPMLKQNYFAGYKLPWTLENKDNWKQTHQLAGKWWMTGGALQLLFAILIKGEILFYIFMTITILVALVPAIYSYFQFKRTKE